MTPKFSVVVERFAVLEEIQGAWQATDFIALLDAMEFDGSEAIAIDELREMCTMCLQDLEPVHAATVVLRHRLGDKLSKGQIDNISNEMLDEKMWEEYVDMALHEQMFAVGSLLYAAFPSTFPKPDAVQVTITAQTANDAAKQQLAQSLHESFIVRLLADGMDENAALHRLFEDQLQGDKFVEADTLVWIVEIKSSSESAVSIEVIGSGYWLDALRETKRYESTAYADEI